MVGGLIQQLLDREQAPEPVLDEAPSHGDDRYLMLKLKKKHQMMMLKRMLSEAGYDDLARMTTISKREIDDDMGV